MGWRFRKSIRLGKNARINVGSKGISSVTFGGRGKPHATVGKNGARVGASIPGTGLYFSEPVGGSKHGAHLAGERSAAAAHVSAGEVPAADAGPVGGEPPSGGGGRHAPAGGGAHRSWVKWVVGIVAVLAVIGGINSCGNHGGEIPNTVGMSLADARTKLQNAGYSQLTATNSYGDAIGSDSGYKVKSQSPNDGKPSKSTEIKLVAGKSLQPVSQIVQPGDKWDQARDALKSAGYDATDYSVSTDDGKSVWDASNWSVASAVDGTVSAKPTVKLRHDTAAPAPESSETTPQPAETSQPAQTEQPTQQTAPSDTQPQPDVQPQQTQQAPAQQPAAGGVLVAVCVDGSRDYSSPGAQDYRGMCSHHGGIAQKLGAQ